MARTFKTGFKITGDAKGAVNATRATRKEIDKLTAAQKRGGSVSQRFAKGMTAGVAGIASMGVAVVAITGAIGRFAKSIADEGDQIQKLSLRLGISTEALSEFSFVFEQAGVKFSQGAVGLQRMTRRLAEVASTGKGVALPTLKALGLAAEELIKLPLDKQFEAIAEELSKIPNQSEKVRLAFSLFDTEGVSLVQTMSKGSAGIRELREEAQRLGLSMSQEFADAAATYNNELSKSQGIMTGIKRQIGEGLLPEMIAITQAFNESAGATDIWRKAGEFAGNMARGMISIFILLKDVIVIAAKNILEAGKIFIGTLQALAAPISGFVTTVGEIFEALKSGDFAGARTAVSGLANNIAKDFEAATEKIDKSFSNIKTNTVDGLKDSFKTINDILLRNAKITSDAADAADAAGEEYDGMGNKAEAAAKQLQTLADRLEPLAALDRKFSVESAILAGKIAEGGDEVERYTELLQLLAIEYGENSTAMMDMGDTTEGVMTNMGDTAETVTQNMGQSFDTFADAVRRGVERMDDLFAGLWKDIFSGGKNMFDTLKNFFTNWLSEMAHAALTRPIVVSMTAAMAGGSGVASAATGAASAAGGALGGAGGLFGGLAGGGFGALFSGFTSIFTGSGIQQAFANFSDIFSGGAANWQFGIAGIVGGILGDKIFGGQGGIGGSLGAVIGTALLPGIGSVVGGLLGGAIGGLFGDRDQRISGGGVDATGKVANKGLNDSALGGFFLGGGAGGVGEFRLAAIDSIQQFDALMASILSENGLAAATDALEGWAITLKKDAVTVENLLNSRFAVILKTLPDDIRQYVEGFSGLEEQVERLGLATGAQRIIDAVPDLFEGRTFQEFIAVAEAMQAEGEDLTQTFNRLVQQMSAISDAYSVIKAIGESSIADDFDDLMDAQSRTLFDVLGSYRSELADLAVSFDGSAESVGRLAELSANLYESELAAMLQIEQVRQGVIAGFGNLREQIERDLFGDEVFYNKIKDRAEDLAEALQTMTDPAEIAATVTEIQRLSGSAYGLLDEDQRGLMGADFLAFMNQVESDALARLGLAENSLIAGSGIDHALITELANGLGDPLEIAASAHIGAAQALTGAAQDISDAVDTGGAFNPVDDAYYGGGGGYDPGLVYSKHTSNDPAVVADDMADAVAVVVADAVSGAGQDTVAAIRTALSSLQININVPAGRLVNE